MEEHIFALLKMEFLLLYPSESWFMFTVSFIPFFPLYNPSLVHPSVHAKQNLVSTVTGTQATLECKVIRKGDLFELHLFYDCPLQVEASPRSVNYWVKMLPGGRDKGVNTEGRFTVVEIDENSYTQRMQLKLERVNWSDFGTYSCVSRNSLGTVRTNVQLQGKISIPLANLSNQHCLRNCNDPLSAE